VSTDDKTPVEPMVTITGTGPNLVTGIRNIKHTDGTIEVVPEGKTIALCACGKSCTKPLCDGSHKNS